LIVHPFETGFDGDMCRRRMDGPEIAFVTGGLKKIAPSRAFARRFWTAHPKKWKLLAGFHQFCHSLQRTNTGPAGSLKLSCSRIEGMTG
jgi:hypothetical protein